ncbi:MAG TPA: class I SAM-dependent methyltransferase [Candidatus Rifleibacterium sp.]|nr:class I SAM-dependent methyltransferase [Candidatus Rifleibacterium sp.]HPT47497.1 class I SAM-dependent methyltransferase [Candidatus Rifleibacterium sp.]
MKKLSHSNRRANNWLVYEINHRFFNRYSKYIGETIYDLGCGEMPYKDFFLQFAKRYIGVDWSGTLHELKADVVADLNQKLPIANEVANTVVSISVLEHLCEPQIMLNEAFRILKPGGKIILQVPWQWWVHEAPHDFFRYTPYGLKYLFEKAGFRDVVVEPASGFFTMWFLKFNYFSARFVMGPRPIRFLIKLLLTPIWFLLQLLAPMLDKLDRNWQLESSGYWVVAAK